MLFYRYIINNADVLLKEKLLSSEVKIFKSCNLTRYSIIYHSVMLNTLLSFAKLY